jgi:glucokinase
MKENISIGVDIGGSHITCAAVDLDNKSILEETIATREVDNQASASEILDTWASALKETLEMLPHTEIKGVGFAMPGPFDYERGIALFERVKKFESLYGINVTLELKRRLDLPPTVPFRYINDATAFAIGEAWAGEGTHYEKVIAVTLGTGFGSAFLKKGVPVTTGDDLPLDGCLWHIPYGDGIADDYISTRWFLSEFEKMTGNRIEGVFEMAELALEDPEIGQIFEEFGSNLGEIILPHAIKFGAEVIILGGNISHAYHLFGNAFEEKLDEGELHVQMLVSELGEDAALLGSARIINGFIS